MNSGRPSKAEQIQIERKLRPYFEKALSISFAAKETGVNANTAKKYYKKWHNEIISAEHPDFIKRSKIIIATANVALDNQLSKLYMMQELHEKQIKHNIKQNKGIPNLENNIYKTSIMLVEKISDLILKKTDLTASPTGDVTLANEIKEYLVENGTT